MPRVSLSLATSEVARRDPVMARLIERAGPPSLRHSRRDESGYFAELAEWLSGQPAVDRVDAATEELSSRGLTI